MITHSHAAQELPHVKEEQKKPKVTQMSTNVSVQQAVEGFLGSIYEKEMLDISTFLHERPDKILAVQHMMKEDSYFK